MFLHGHPVNQHRQTEGKPIVNSMVMGQWKFQYRYSITPQTYTSVWTDNPWPWDSRFTSRFRFTHRLKASQNFLLMRESPLVILDPLLFRVYEDSDGWRKAFEQRNKLALSRERQSGAKDQPSRHHRPHHLRQIGNYTITASERWKFWKPPSRLQRCRQLAESANQ